MTPSRADGQIRDKLKSVRDQLGDARDRRAEALKERDSAKSSFAGADFSADTKITETSEFQAAEQAVARVGKIDDEIADLRATEQGILSMLGDMADHTGLGGGGAHNPSLEQVRTHWDGHQLLAASDEFKLARESGVFNSTARFGTVTLGQVASREQAIQMLQGMNPTMGAALPAAPAGVLDSTVSYIPPDFRGTISPALMPLNLLDLIPTGTTDSNVINYVQITAIPGNAAEVAEHAVKPEEGLTTIDATAPVRTIAGWLKTSRQSLDDIAGLGTLINTLLPYDVRRRILAQVLAGDGTGQNLTGIYNTAGVAAPAAVTGDNVADAILRAMTIVVMSDQDPNFVGVNPITWQNLLLMREGSDLQDTTANPAAFKGEYLYGGPGLVQAPTIWGLRITTSRVIPQAHPLVGDSMGCSLLVREGVNIKTSDSDQDDFIRNRVTILAEARVAFPVWRPSAFAIVAQG